MFRTFGRRPALVLQPEEDVTDWSTVAVACLAALFVCLLVFAVWKANQMDAAPITGDTRATQSAVTSPEK